MAVSNPTAKVTCTPLVEVGQMAPDGDPLISSQRLSFQPGPTCLAEQIALKG